jgi:endonuclease G
MRLFMAKILKLKNGYFIPLTVVLALAVCSFFRQAGEDPGAGEDVFPVEGIEIPARIAERREQVIVHVGYTVSYNADWKIPNWVAYELTRAEVEGVVPRGSRFVPDPEVPVWESATDGDYRGSGWDRGHMAPAADMKWSVEAMRESFYFSNVCPQNKGLNAGVWKDLEEWVRGLAARRGSVFVVCGPLVSERSARIGRGRVLVPDAFFKVLLRRDGGGWSAIAFVFENGRRRGRGSLLTYATSVEEVQTLSGIDFFPALPDSIERVVERSVDVARWRERGED